MLYRCISISLLRFTDLLLRGHVTRTGASPPTGADQSTPRRFGSNVGSARQPPQRSALFPLLGRLANVSRPARLWSETKSSVPRFCLQVIQRRVRTARGTGRRSQACSRVPGVVTGIRTEEGRACFFHLFRGCGSPPGPTASRFCRALDSCCSEPPTGSWTVNLVAENPVHKKNQKHSWLFWTGLSGFGRRGLTWVQHAGRVRSGAVRKTQQWGLHLDPWSRGEEAGLDFFSALEAEDQTERGPARRTRTEPRGGNDHGERLCPSKFSRGRWWWKLFWGGENRGSLFVNSQTIFLT